MVIRQIIKLMTKAGQYSIMWLEPLVPNLQRGSRYSGLYLTVVRSWLVLLRTRGEKE